MSIFEINEKRILVKCQNNFCENHVWTTLGPANRHNFTVYCEPCRADARKLYDRTYYERRKARDPKFLNRKNARARIKYRSTKKKVTA